MRNEGTYIESSEARMYTLVQIESYLQRDAGQPRKGPAQAVCRRRKGEYAPVVHGIGMDVQ
ncbi:MAG: hypothetical protein QOG21_546 [Actinomycetota bacterium]|nr:hypothetical protein [Actinomycetota bacterium]